MSNIDIYLFPTVIVKYQIKVVKIFFLFGKFDRKFRLFLDNDPLKRTKELIR